LGDGLAFRDDECRIRKANTPANFATVKHMASNLLRRAPGKDSLRVKRKLAAWDDDYLAALVTRRWRSPDSPGEVTERPGLAGRHLRMITGRNASHSCGAR
jgi:hypothetical protein